MSKQLKIVSGSAQWAKVFEPDTKFDPLGVYTINVQMPDADAVELGEQLDQIVQEKKAETIKDDLRLKSFLTTAPTSVVVLDRETGDPTGYTEFKLKLKAKVRKRDGTTYEQKPVVLDAKKQPVDPSVMIGNGSTVKVAFEPIPYYMPSTKTVGVSLRLKAVQVVDLVEYGAPATSIFDEEDGYVASPPVPSSSDIFKDASVPEATTQGGGDDSADF